MTTHPAIRGHSERICSNCGTRPYDHLPHVRITSTSRAQTIITSLERQNLDNRDLVRIAAADEFLVLHFCFLGRVEPIVLQIPATRVSRFVFRSCITAVAASTRRAARGGPVWSVGRSEILFSSLLIQFQAPIHQPQVSAGCAATSPAGAARLRDAARCPFRRVWACEFATDLAPLAGRGRRA